MLIIRPFVPSDQDRVIQLISTSLSQIFHSPARDLDDLYRIDLHYAEGIFLVSELDGYVVGTIGVVPQDGHAYMKRLYVDPAYRTQGIGTLLYQAALDYCVTNQYRKVLLTTSPLMEVAQKFYLRQGFVEYDRDEVIYMAKVL